MAHMRCTGCNEVINGTKYKMVAYDVPWCNLYYHTECFAARQIEDERKKVSSIRVRAMLSKTAGARRSVSMRRVHRHRQLSST